MNIYKQIELETSRLILRGHRDTDFPSYWEMLNDVHARQYTGGITTLSYEKREELFLTQCHGFGRDDYEFAVTLKETGQYIGYCGFQYNGEEKEMELLYGLLQHYWGHGYITEACEAVLSFGFSQLNLMHIISFSHPENKNSQNVLKKLGMMAAGTVQDDDNNTINKYILYHPEEVSL